MILYVNGDSHTAAAEAVNPHAFAMDDGDLFYMGRAPHPANLAVSWGKLLSQSLRASFHCGAESASSNSRIVRTTREWLSTTPRREQLLVVIQWSTWEREEWLHNDTYYQVGSSGIDDIPTELQKKYKHFVIDTDWQTKTEQAHKEIWEFHNELQDQNIKHIFFNSEQPVSDQHDWGTNYIRETYTAKIQDAKIETVSPNSKHFGKNGHSIWNRFLLNHIITNNFI